MLDHRLIDIIISFLDLGGADIPSQEIREGSILKTAITLARRNGLCYPFLQSLKAAGFRLSAREEERWRTEVEKAEKFRGDIAFLDNLLKTNGLSYVQLKTCSSVPHVPRDIDIFVKNVDRKKTLSLLERSGLVCVHSSVIETSLIGEHGKIDIYTDICYFGIEFIDARFLWDSSIENEMWGRKYTCLNKKADFLLMLVHTLLGHQSMSLLDFLHMKSLKDKSLITECRSYAYNKGWGYTFDLALQEFDRISQEVYTGSRSVPFPYLFDRGLILDCLSAVEGFSLDMRKRFYINVSLVQDRVIHKLENSWPYELLRSSHKASGLINSLSAVVKRKRGDRKSTNEPE